MQHAPISPAATVGLDLFASAWLGGTVSVDRETKAASICIPMPGRGGHTRIEGADERQRTWYDGYDTGRWRESSTFSSWCPAASMPSALTCSRFPTT